MGTREKKTLGALLSLVMVPVLLTCAAAPAAMAESRVRVSGTDPYATPMPAGATAAPVIESSFAVTKNPTSEEILEGSSVIFVTHGKGHAYMVWYLVSPAGEWINVADIGARFPSLGVDNSNGIHLRLWNVPKALNNYQVITMLVDAQGNKLYTDGGCYLYVNTYADLLPDPTPTPLKTTPAPTATPAPTPIPTRAPASAHRDPEEIPDIREGENGRAEVVMLTDVDRVKDGTFNQAIYDGVKVFADTYGLTYRYYEPDGLAPEKFDTAAIVRSAAEKGARVVVMGGASQTSSLADVAAAFPQIHFIAMDCDRSGIYNVAGIIFRDEQSGFLAGYSAVMEGYSRLGFMGGGSGMDPAVCRYGHGFVQGASAAAVEKGINVTVSYSWRYGSAYSATPELHDLAAEWYQRGTQVIFSCGGSMFTAISAAAVECGGKVIGVDVDQSGQSPAVLTSAVKGLAEATLLALETDCTGHWEEIGGKTSVLGAKEGAVCLPGESWIMETFTRQDYEQLLQRVAEGSIEVDSTVLTGDAIASRSFPRVTLLFDPREEDVKG